MKDKKEYDKKYYEDNIVKIKIRHKDWYNKNIITSRKSSFKKNYSISLEDYNRVFEEQGGCCAICGKHQSEFKKSLCVDHDHITGKIRGLLCANCNFILGHAFDDINVLYKAITYLESKA